MPRPSRVLATSGATAAKGNLPGLTTLLRRLGLIYTRSATHSHATHAAARVGLDKPSPPPILPPFLLLPLLGMQAADRLAHLGYETSD